MGKMYSVGIKKRFEVMDLLTSGVITESQAAEQLLLSVRQIQRIKKRFILGEKTIESLLFHRQHPQVNKVPDSICQKVVFLKQEGPIVPASIFQNFYHLFYLRKKKSGL